MPQPSTEKTHPCNRLRAPHVFSGSDDIGRRGGNVAHIRVALLTLALASTLGCVQAGAQAFRDPQPDFAPTFGGGALTCSQPKKLLVPPAFVERAKLKARLSNILRESLFDDAKGIVNIAREKEIKELANKLKIGKAR
jgi:hypothetical protein